VSQVETLDAYPACGGPHPNRPTRTTPWNWSTPLRKKAASSRSCSICCGSAQVIETTTTSPWRPATLICSCSPLAGLTSGVFLCRSRRTAARDRGDDVLRLESSLGGVLCPDHARDRSEASRLSLSALKVLRHALRADTAAFTALTLRESVLSELSKSC